MAKNINQLIRNNQRYLAILIAGIIAGGGGVVYGVNKWINAPKEEVKTEFEEDKTIQPDLTGSISNTFDGKVSSQVITDAQTESKENREALKRVLDKLESMDNRLTEIDKEREEFKKKIDELTVSVIGNNVWMIYNKAPFDPELTPSTATYGQGNDYFMQPSLRSIGFNVKVKL